MPQCLWHGYEETWLTVDRHVACPRVASACTYPQFAAKSESRVSPGVHWLCAPHPIADCPTPSAESVDATLLQSLAALAATSSARILRILPDANAPWSA